MPIFPSILSITAFISSAAPFPTIILFSFIPKLLEASKEFTLIPDGYCVNNISKFDFISSIIFSEG